MLGIGGVAAKDYSAVLGEGVVWKVDKAQAHRPHIGNDGMMPVTFADIDLSAQTAWVQGFLSAFNYYGEATAPNIVTGIDANGVLLGSTTAVPGIHSTPSQLLPLHLSRSFPTAVFNNAYQRLPPEGGAIGSSAS